MLFHVTIGHDAQECPGRRPTELTGLVAPSDTREAMAAQLRVKLHFVLWGAACMLWAQPEHLAFAVLEAEDVESVLQYMGALVPQTWTYKVRPVWNLPSQLRLIRQVQLAPTMLTGDALTPPEPTPLEPTRPEPTRPEPTRPEPTRPEPTRPEPTPSTAEPVTQLEPDEPQLSEIRQLPSTDAEPSVSEPALSAPTSAPPSTLTSEPPAMPRSEPTSEPAADDGFKTQPPVSVSFPTGESIESEDAADRAPVADIADSGDPAAHRTWPQTDADDGSPSTITRLLEELETPTDAPELATAGGGQAPASTGQPPSADQATHIEQFVPKAPPRVRAWLVATVGPSRGSSFPLPVEGATLGRLPENTIYIPDERLSREHARIDFRDGKFVLSDLGSRNGTAVNGSLLSTSQPLNNGDTIELGSNTLVVNIETAS